MPDQKLQAIEPVTVAVIGGTGDGSPLTTGTTGTTPDHQPNLVVQVVTPLVAILVRAIYTFLDSICGLIITAGVVKTGLPATDFFAVLQLAVGGSIGITLFGVLRNTATIFSGLEKKFPLGAGSV